MTPPTARPYVRHDFESIRPGRCRIVPLRWHGSARSLASRLTKLGRGKFVTRKAGDTVEVWRLA